MKKLELYEGLWNEYNVQMGMSLKGFQKMIKEVKELARADEREKMGNIVLKLKLWNNQRDEINPNQSKRIRNKLINKLLQKLKEGE